MTEGRTARPLTRIEEERWRMHKSKREICADLSITDKTYRNYVSGATPVPSSVLIMLREMTGKSVDWLLGFGEA